MQILKEISLKNFVLGALTGLPLIIIIVILYISIILTSNELTNKSGSSFSDLATINSEQFKDDLNSQFSVLRTLSSNQNFYTRLSQVDQDLLQKQSTDINSILAQRQKDWLNNANPSLKSSIVTNAASIGFDSFITSFNGYAQLLLVDKQGKLMAEAGEDSQNYLFNTQKWFTDINKVNDAYDVFIADQTINPDNSTYLNFVIPVSAPNTGQVRGYIFAKYRVEKLNMFQGTSTNINVLLANNSDVILYSNNQKDAGLRVPPSIESIISNQRTANWSTGLDTNTNTNIIYGYKRITIVSNTQYTINSTDWLIIVKEDKNIALSAITTIENAFILVGVIAFILSTILAFFISKYITNPIKSLTQTATDLYAGNYSTQASISGPKELQILGKTFNDMTQKLITVNSELEGKVKEKTLNLEDKNKELNHLAEELQSKLGDLERVNKLMIDRELKMIALKEEIDRLTKEKKS